MFLDLDKKKPDKLAVISEEGISVTYRDLLEHSEDMRKVFDGRNLVFILCRNKIGAFMSYVACMVLRQVPLLLSADLDEDLLQYLLKTYRPNYICLPKDQVERIVSGDADGEDHDAACRDMRVLEDITLDKYGYSVIRYSFDPVDLYPDLALLLTTSGSTGSPKLVRQSYRNIEANAESICEYLELGEDERPITMLPMNYTYGLSVIHSHLLSGATILMTDCSYMQKPFWEFFKKEGATSIVGVPYTYEILKKLRFFRMELPSLRYMTQAGGKLLPELHREYAEYARDNNRRFYVMYGQTEATARMSYLPYEKSLEKYGSMGIAIPGGSFRLIDVDGNVIDQPEIVGELVYEGENVTLGYAECQEDLAHGDERHGVLVTGDMAKRDLDGYYYIVGRKKRFLKIYGNRVNLDECERMLQSEYEGVEFACVGEDDHMRIYTTISGHEEEIVHFISGKTGLNGKAFEVFVIDLIPKNDAGKKQYSEIEKP